ncbi:MAG TPA: tRNA (adenosine(37)-N6)-dimethylallyltransferase MiaA [Candidatus Binataceae bacterium]|jgi:tRNA dimethylallyltransferase|nr:tRNA (adenosine(37)-N6)-dimethylallyltransferase MiaA [Candidatus Binataceae bacterium]
MSIVAREESAPGAARAPGAVEAIRVGFIVGPTGAGKTAIALELAERLGAEIVNADSRQVYRGLDVGTAKPTAEERRRVPHHLIDVRDPSAPLDVAGFVALARGAIADIAARGRAPLVVGGSGLYLRVLRGGIFAGPPAAPELRRELAALAAARGVECLHAWLAEVDPAAAGRIGHNDLYRITRALEVYRLTGQPISVHQERHRFAARPYETLTLGIAMERKRLYEAIDRRFDEMVARGLVGEVRALLAAGCDPGRAPLRTVGYRQIAAAVRGETALEEAIALAKRDTRRLAKRQLTWFRADPEIRWIDAERGLEQAFEMLSAFFARAERAGI